MTLKRQFVIFLVVWAILTLPGFIFGMMLAGDDWAANFNPSGLQLLDQIVWLISMVWLFSPLLLAPVGIVKRNSPNAADAE